MSQQQYCRHHHHQHHYYFKCYHYNRTAGQLFNNSSSSRVESVSQYRSAPTWPTGLIAIAWLATRILQIGGWSNDEGNLLTFSPIAGDSFIFNSISRLRGCWVSLAINFQRLKRFKKKRRCCSSWNRNFFIWHVGCYIHTYMFFINCVINSKENNLYFYIITYKYPYMYKKVINATIVVYGIVHESACLKIFLKIKIIYKPTKIIHR